MDENYLDMQHNENTDINKYSMDVRGNIKADNSGAAAVEGNLRTYIILGWVSAAISAFVSPYFAILGVILGVLANRKVKGSGTAIIATNIVLGLVSFIFRVFFWEAVRRMMTGY